ncbi:MAG: sigma-70 family RNA polymerase sigma factor [Ruminococcus sp.]|nr:sigma-70 family RNA polymerase sigma factor [Ruminococcus sp.]
MNRSEISALAERAKQGDSAAFEQLYTEFRSQVYYFCKRCVGSESAAEDLTSETFIDAMEKIGSLRSGAAFSGWLYAIAYNKCSDHLRSNDRSEVAATPEQLSEAALNAPLLLPDDYAINAETRAQLQSIIDGLSPDQRSAVIMYYYDEMSVSEVAEAMGTNENNVSQKLHRARKKIRAQIEKLIGKGAMFGAVPMRALLGELDTSTVGIAAAGAAAIAVGIPYGLSKASGGTARELLWITRKYWAKHKKSLAALLFSGVLLCAVVTCIFLNGRRDFITGLDHNYDLSGRQTFMITDDHKEVIDFVSKEDTVRGEVAVLGRTGIGKNTFEYAVLDDPENLAHLPIESGRLPEKEGEIAIYRSVLNVFGFFGSVGESITLDTGTYTLVGILHDEEFTYRNLSRLYIEQVYNGDVFGPGTDSFKHYFPMIFVGGDAGKAPEYSYILLDNVKYVSIPDKDLEDHDSFKDDFSIIVRDADESVFTDDNDGSYNNWAYYAVWGGIWSFRAENHKIMPLYIVAALISSLSVLAVMRNIFAEREDTVRMLRRIGVSKRRIRVMYTIEYLCLAGIQTVIGIALGSAAHLGICAYRTSVMGYKDFTGFTPNELSSWIMPNPFIAGASVGAAVLLAGYLTAALLSRVKAPSRKKKKAAALWRCFGRVFRTRAVTVIQTLSLALICFGTIYGYMLFHSTEGSFDPETGEFHELISTEFGQNRQFSFDEDGVEEYYSASEVKTAGSGSFLFALHSEHFDGIGDSDADSLEGITAHGNIPHTFIVADSGSKLKNSITYGSAEEKQFFIDHSSEEGKALLNSGKALYKSPVALADIGTINELSQYVTSGEINADKLNSGEEVLLVVRYGNAPLAASDTVTVGAADTDNGFGISKLTQSDTKIGAVVVLPKSMDRILRYSVSEGDDYNLLTTASGAEALGLAGARYTELFAKEALGNSLPLGTGFTLYSYAQQRREIFLRNASFYGSMGALVLVMSLLGFSAYFNGIGLKIRLKEYQISIMRAVGTPIKRLRRRLTLDSIRLPLISGTMAYGGIKAMQLMMLAANNRADKLANEARIAFNELSEISSAADHGYTPELLSKINAVNDIQARETDVRVYFMTDKMMLFMNALIPTLTIFAVMCIVTILLTRKSFRMFTPDIAGALARGRKRR